MKSIPQATIIKLVLLISIAVLFAACPGSDNNQTDSSNNYSNANDREWTSTSSGAITYNYSVADIVAHTKSQAPECSGGSRIDMNIATSNIASQSTIAANGSNNGSPLSGGVVAYYIGESYWKDLMIISKMDDGQFNVTISFCPYSNVLTSEKQLTEFQAPYGITVASNTTGIGSILAAKNTYIKIEQSGVQSINFGPTTFYPVQIQ